MTFWESVNDETAGCRAGQRSDLVPPAGFEPATHGFPIGGCGCLSSLLEATSEQRRRCG